MYEMNDFVKYLRGLGAVEDVAQNKKYFAL